MRCASEGAVVFGFEGLPAAPGSYTSRGTELLDEINSRQWVIEGFLIHSGAPYRSVISLKCAKIYTSGETTRRKNSFQLIMESYLRVFEEDR